MDATGQPLPLTYVLPVRWGSPGGVAELGAYLGELRQWVSELVVVDASPPAVFGAIAAGLPPGTRHVRPDPELSFAMGKVDGVLTGLAQASEDLAVVADDDVRWDREGLERAVRLLATAEVVRPQNYFEPLVWHARIDTARSLINRAWSGDRALGAGDFPGTLAVRTEFVRAIGGYDGNCLFENLELMRTVLAAGGRVVTPLDLFVARRPPPTSHFLSQRVRQAYDDFAIPVRMAAWLALGPTVARAIRRRRRRRIAVLALGAIAVAETGRRRGRGASVFPMTSSLLAPVWLTERAVCSWLALRDRLFRGGVSYGESRLARSAHSLAELRSSSTSSSEATVVGVPSA